MRPTPSWRRIFRHEPSERHVDADVDAELRFHFEMTVRDLMAHDMSSDEARREAERRFGDVERTRNALRRIDHDRVGHWRRAEALSAWRQDIRYASRALRSSPGFAMTVVLTLGLGIGANAMMFGIVDRLLVRGAPYVADARQVRRVYMTQSEAGGPRTDATVGYVLYTTLRDGARSLQGVAAYRYEQRTLGRGAQGRRIPIGAATSDMFRLLGVRAAMGRFFTADEDRPPTGDHVTLLSHEFWQRELGGRADVIGTTVLFNDERFTVVGVAPAGFTGPELQQAQAWIPMSVASATVSKDWPTTWNAQWLRLVARVKPGVSDRQIHDDLTSVMRRAYTGKDQSLVKAEVDARPLWFDRSGKPSGAVDVSRWLLGVAVVVLLIACANVANLLLARAVTRRREIAVRLALGVSRGRLVRLLLAESTLLAAVGGMTALALAYVGSRVMRATLLRDVAWPDSGIDARLLGFTAMVAIVTGIVVGLAPALRASRPGIASTLVGNGRGGVPLRSRLRTSLVVTQAALSVILLVGAGLFVRSLWKVRNLDLGLQPDRVLVASISWPSTSIGGLDDQERARRRQLFARALERAQRMPEVEHAAIAVGTPFISGFSVGLKVPGRDSIPTLPGGNPSVSAVTSDYFATVGGRLLRGRIFRPTEGANTERVVIVNQTMARALWPGEDAIGKCVIAGDDETRCSQVVGIVADARRSGLREKPAMQYYMPLGQESGFGGSLILVRPKGSVREFLDPVRRMLVDVAPDLLYARVETLQDNLDPQVRPWRLGATMFGIFGGLAMIVAAIGLYSVIAYAVTQRRHELGVRLALGARAGNIVGLVVRSGMATTVAGVAIGILAALLGGRFIESLLFDTSARDPLVFAVVAGVLIAVSLIATLVPAGRAARVDPATALRAD